MSSKTLLRLLALLFSFTLIAAACGSDDDAADDGETTEEASTEESTDEGEAMEDVASGAPDECVEGSLNISGSSTVEPISTRVAELYEDNCSGASITVDGPGTGDGFALFCAGETDISDASRQIKDSEAEECAANGIEYTELLVAFDGIAVMTNPNNSAVDCLSFVDLYALLGGESEGFDTWAAASDLGAGLGSTVAPYPDAELAISAPGTESGTYDSFIEIVLEDAAEASQGEEVAAGFIRTDFSGNADDNVIIEGISGNDTSLGWVGFAFAEENADIVKTLSVTEEPGGDCVAPTIETIADGSYPVSRGLYIYANNEKLQSNPLLAPYLDYYLGEAYNESVTKAFGESGYVPLPADLKAATDAAFASAG